ncbi:hypothetical protein [Sporolactobacillus inulinus]|nr:hypothetical protein [Sporolactobacillus inulinus]
MKDIAQVVPIDKLIETRDLSVIQTSLLDGYFMIQPSKRSQHVYLIPCPKNKRDKSQIRKSKPALSVRTTAL